MAPRPAAVSIQSIGRSGRSTHREPRQPSPSPGRVKCSCYFQQLLYQKSPVAFDMAESMILKGLQLDSAKEQRGGVAGSGRERGRRGFPRGNPLTQLLMSTPGTDPRKEERTTVTAVKQKSAQGTDRRCACWERVALIFPPRIWCHLQDRKTETGRQETRGVLNNEGRTENMAEAGMERG